MGLDFERDIKITPEDIEIHNRLRRERRPLTMDEYLAFLKTCRGGSRTAPTMASGSLAPVGEMVGVRGL